MNKFRSHFYYRDGQFTGRRNGTLFERWHGNPLSDMSHAAVETTVDRAMVSVCMAIKDGSQYIDEQLDSILPHLGRADELVISDDGSTDNTLTIVESYADPRIRVLRNPRQGLISNFEHALQESRGEIIFLSDQDDVWYPQKFPVMINTLATCDLAVCDCQVVDRERRTIYPSFFKFNRSRPGLIRNIIRSSFMGCCMAFHRRVLDRALPFPDGVPIHDQWIGLVAERYFRVKFVPSVMLEHRRHQKNYSTTGGPSPSSIEKKLSSRLTLARKLFMS